MAQHLGQQASELPVLKIHPKSVFLIVYPGGHCGEFLSWWLGLHPGCVRTQVRGIQNNRYIWQPSYRYEYNEQGTRDKLFLSAHPGNTVSKCGFTVSDFQQHISLYSDARYKQFFYYLFLIKTYFLKHSTRVQPRFFTADQWTEFLKYLGTRDSFYIYEAEKWINNDHNSFRHFVYTKWYSLAGFNTVFVEDGFNVGELFFGNTERETQTLLDILNIKSNPRLSHYLPEYHQRNIAVVEKYSGMNIDQFLNLDINQLLDATANRAQHFS